MTAIRQLYLTSLVLLFSPISALQMGNSNKTACESSNVTIDFSFNLGNDTFLDRSWYKHSSVAANKIARVNSTGSWTVEPQYSGRVTLSGLGGITLYNVTKRDSGNYLFVILTNISSEDGTATTTVDVYAIPNTSCIPILEKHNADSYTCKIPEACPGKESIQATWDDGSFSCPSTTVSRIYRCCAKGDQIAYCYNGSLCTDFQCSRTDAVFKSHYILFFVLVICISFIIMVILIIDLIFWIKYSLVSIFMEFLKISHQCLHILYLVLLIIVVFCEIVIIIITIIGCQCQITLGVGLGLSLFIITVSCIFWVVFIKSEVIIHHKDTTQNPRINTNVKITAFLRQIFISDVEWIGPNGNKLTTEGKYIIDQYNSNTGETSLTITNVSWDDNGSYICQSKNGCKLAKDSIHILCADKTKWTKNTGPPACYIKTQNKVVSKPNSKTKQTDEGPQPLPPANYEDAQGLPTGTPRPNRLTPLSPRRASVQEEDVSEGTKKKRKKKQKKGEKNEKNQEEEIVELKSKRTLPEDIDDED